MDWTPCGAPKNQVAFSYARWHIDVVGPERPVAPQWFNEICSCPRAAGSAAAKITAETANNEAAIVFEKWACYGFANYVISHSHYIMFFGVLI